VNQILTSDTYLNMQTFLTENEAQSLFAKTL